MSSSGGTTAPKPAAPTKAKSPRGKKRVTFEADGAGKPKPPAASKLGKPAAAQQKKKKAAAAGAKKKRAAANSAPLTSISSETPDSVEQDPEVDRLAREIEDELALTREEEEEEEEEETTPPKVAKKTEEKKSSPKPAGAAKSSVTGDPLTPHMKLHGGNYETTVIQARKRTDQTVAMLTKILEDDSAFESPTSAKQCVANCLLALQRVATDLVETQVDFERTLRQIKCRAWAGAVNDATSETLGPYALAGVWR